MDIKYMTMNRSLIKRSFVSVDNLKYSVDGCFWWTRTNIPVITGNIKAILKATTPHILKFMGVPMSNIKQTP